MPKEDYIETIPVGPLGIISLKGCSKLGGTVEDYIVSWRNGRNNEHSSHHNNIYNISFNFGINYMGYRSVYYSSF